MVNRVSAEAIRMRMPKKAGVEEPVICSEDGCGHMQCVVWWNTQAVKGLTEEIRKALFQRPSGN